MAIKDVLRNFDKLTNEMEKQAERAINEVGADLLKESNLLTPFDKGWLRKSGKLDLANSNNKLTATVSYGDSRVDYAAAVHEINKNYNEPGTGWKYLEKPLKEKAGQYIKYFQNKIGDKL